MYKLTLVTLFAFTIGCALSRDIRSETTCQTHKRNTGGRGALMTWDIQCDAQGNYLPLQCIKETPKWCSCYSKDKQVSSPSKNTKSCECHLAKALIPETANRCEFPVCDKSGKFQKKQCSCDRKCYCVNPTTGQKVTEPSSNQNLRC